MAKPMNHDEKLDSLRRHGALNPQAHRVREPLFGQGGFFDSRDLVQVKYEMLRRADKDGEPVSQVSSVFGLSRVSFYQAQKAFAREGVVGLLPKKRGPRKGHKLTEEVLAYLDALEAAGHLPKASALAGQIQERFGIEIHPRSIERALAQRKKKQP